MDVRFSDHPKIEREYQQAVVRDNNRHSDAAISRTTSLWTSSTRSPRMPFPDRRPTTSLTWLASAGRPRARTRRNGLVTPVIMEMKAGDGALASASQEVRTLKISHLAW